MEGVQWAINALAGIVFALFGWIAKDYQKRIEALETSSGQVNLAVATLNAQHPDLMRRLDRIEAQNIEILRELRKA